MKRVCSLLVLVICWSASLAEAAVIRLRSEGAVQGTLIQLGDLAEINTEDAREEERLKRVTIAPAPAEGRTVKISLDTIRRELTLRGVEQTGLQFTGASEVQVLRLVTTEVAIRNAESKVPERRNLSEQSRQLEVSLQQQILQQVMIATPNVSMPRVVLKPQQLQQVQARHPEVVRWQLQGSPLLLSGMQGITIQGVTREGQTVMESVDCQLIQKGRVLGLRQGLPRGQVIREADLVWLESESTEGCFTQPEQVVGTETLRSLRSEMPLKQEDVRPMPLVRRNEVVAVTAQIGSITVRRYCRSLEEAAYGQFVTLVPVDGKEKITARVSGLREAEIVLESRAGAGASLSPAGTGTLTVDRQPMMIPTRSTAAPTTGNTVPNQTEVRAEVESRPHRPAVDLLTTDPAAIQPVSFSTPVKILANQPTALPQGQ